MRYYHFCIILALAACTFGGCSDESSAVGANHEQTGSGDGLSGEQTDPDKTDSSQNNPDNKKPYNPCDGVDFMTSNQNCGECGNACTGFDKCVDGKCTCPFGYYDCDNDGKCDTIGRCACKEGDEIDCYYADETTKNVGECRPGKMTCVIEKGYGAYFSECIGAVMPSYDYVCDPNRPDLDIDCNGTPDAEQDEDGDGYTICNETGDEILDCCDSSAMCGKTRTDLIHPNIIDCIGNNYDDDCDGIVDNGTVVCGSDASAADCTIKNRSCSSAADMTFGLPRNASPAGALALAHAFDACLDIVSKDSNKPGLIEYTITPSSIYNIGIDARQFNIKDGMYDADGNKLIAPRTGNTFVLLSTGIAGDVKTELSNPAIGIEDYKFSLGGSIPEPYKSAHGNQLQSHPACASGGADIYDTVKLHLKMRAPSTAKGISFDFRFFSREYPYYVCSKYNDFFLALLTDDSGAPMEGVAPDGNISFDKTGNPISVNNAFFTTCTESPCSGNFSAPADAAKKCPAMIACDDSTNTCGGKMCKDGAAELAAYYPQYYASSDNDPKVNRGGGTAWLTTKAPVKPGEVFNLDFYIWDTGDLRFDSTVILDNFQWQCDETAVGTDFATDIGTAN